MLKLELEMKLELLVQLKYSAAAAAAIYFKLFCGWNPYSLPDIDFFGSGAKTVMNEWLNGQMVGWMDGSIDCFEWDESILTLTFQYLEKYTHTIRDLHFQWLALENKKSSVCRTNYWRLPQPQPPQSLTTRLWIIDRDIYPKSHSKRQRQR